MIRPLDGLGDCGCGAGAAVETPRPTFNRPGLAAIAYRVGDWADFKRSLLARLSSADFPDLAALKNRDDNDFSIALLDSWAVVADVLTFYQERHANENYLGTAVERYSVLELARLIGYQLNPGVAASAYLAFETEDVSGGAQTAALAAQTDAAVRVLPAPTRPTIPAGAKVQSVPGPNETPQIFETVEPLEARPEWNRLRPRLERPRQPREADLAAWLRGAPALDPGDRLLFVGQERLDSPVSDRWNLRRVVRVEPQPKNSRTRVVWDQPLVNPPADSRVFVLRRRASIFGYNAPDWMSLPKGSKLSYLGLPESVSVPDLYALQWPQFRIFSPQFPEQPAGTGVVPQHILATVQEVAAAARSSASGASQNAAGGAVAQGMGAVEGASNIADTTLDYAQKAAHAAQQTAELVADQVVRAAKIPLDAGVATLASLVQPAAVAVAQRALDDLQYFVDSMDAPDSAAGALLPVAALAKVRDETLLLKDSVTGLALDENPAVDALDQVVEHISSLSDDLPGLLEALGDDANPLVAAYDEITALLSSDDPSPEEVNSAVQSWLTARIDELKSELASDTTSPYHEAMQRLADLPGDLGDLSTRISNALNDPAGTVGALLQAMGEIAAESAAASHTIAAEVSKTAMETGGGALRQMDSMVRSSARQAAAHALETAAALNPLPDLQAISADAAGLASAVEQAARAATEAVAASVAASAVDLAVDAELQDPECTPESVAAAAKEALRIAVEVAPHVVTAGVGGIAYGPAGLIAAAAAGGADEVAALAGLQGQVENTLTLGHAGAATQGAVRVQTRVGAAVELALEGKMLFWTIKRPLPSLTDDAIDLDQSYPSLAAGGWVVLSLPDGASLYRTEEASESSRADFLLSGKTTRLRLSGDLAELASRFGGEVRKTAVFTASEELPLASTPIDDPVRGDAVTLDAAVEGLEAGRRLIVTGRRARRVRLASEASPLLLTSEDAAETRLLRAGDELHQASPPEAVEGSFDARRWRLTDASGFTGTLEAPSSAVEYVDPEAEDASPRSEYVTLDRLEAVDETHSKLVLSSALSEVYERAGLSIAANVALSTHGESVAEQLGSGDASQPFQKFTLRQQPLTYVSSSAPPAAPPRSRCASMTCCGMRCLPYTGGSRANGSMPSSIKTADRPASFSATASRRAACRPASATCALPIAKASDRRASSPPAN